MNVQPSGELKGRLRKEILEARARLSQQERDEKSRTICARLLDMPAFERAGTVMAYMDFRYEAGTAGILSECYKRGKRVALPVITNRDGNGRTLQAYEAGPGGGLLRNRYGICEPDPDRSERIGETELDLIIVPGVVFDRARHRIGYGAGYYDRFLARVGPACRTAGIAFDLQVVDRVPAEKHDIPLDMVITEYRVIV